MEMIKRGSVNKLLLVITIVFIAMIQRSAAQNNLVSMDYTPSPHPRLFLLKGEESTIIKECREEGLKMKVNDAIINECNVILTIPPIEHKLLGKRLLMQSREFLKRIFYLSFAYRITSDTRYAERAEREMLTVADFNDWNPTHFLDVAEMTTGMAIGYDWLYDQLSPSSKTRITSSIISLGLMPSLDSVKCVYWQKGHDNWSQVCNTGMTLGALAIYESNPKLANHIINRSIESIKSPMKEYSPDGAYPEGFNYWGYGTTYNVLYLSAIEKAFGQDFGLSDFKGFLQSSRYMLNVAGANGLPFNYSDASQPERVIECAMFWFQKKSHDNSILYGEIKSLKKCKTSDLAKDRFLPALMIWAEDIKLSQVSKPNNLIWIGQGRTPVALMRNSWDDPNALFVGFKGGSPSTNHAHMDVGSFVLDGYGERWAMDLGMEDYTVLEAHGVDLFNNSQNSPRWQVYRHSNYHHNTLTVNDALQNVKGFAKILSSRDYADSLSATVDLTSLYSPALVSAKRTVSLDNKDKVVVKDALINTDKDTKVRWTLVTPAKVAIIDDNTIELKQHHKTMTVKLNYKGKAIPFSTPAKSPNSYERDNEGAQLTGFDFMLARNEQVDWEITFREKKK